MGLLNIIRRMHLRQKLSIREISRRTGLSRNTVTKHVAAGTIEPIFATPDRPSKLAPFAEKLAGWLKTEAGKSRKQRRTLKQLHAEQAEFIPFLISFQPFPSWRWKSQPRYCRVASTTASLTEAKFAAT